MNTIVVVLFLVLYQVGFSAHWGSNEKTGVTIQCSRFEAETQECLDAFLEARIKYEIRMCRRRSMWFDPCEEARQETHTIVFDSITDSYRVVSDRYGDDSAPIAVGVPSRKEATSATLGLENVPLSFLVRGNQTLLMDPQAYIQVRGTFSCKGIGNRTLSSISQIITLGLVGSSDIVSDWVDFELARGVSDVGKER
jgi:hypothetical protein